MVVWHRVRCFSRQHRKEFGCKMDLGVGSEPALLETARRDLPRSGVVCRRPALVAVDMA